MDIFKYWKKKSHEEIKQRVFGALDKNINYAESHAFGIPASYLDSHVFSQEESFLKDAPFISTLVQNPNHIGCHTLGKSEAYFAGTQAIEKELIELCAVDILKGEPEEQDGYVASGGTEANMQAIWIYRNYFMKSFGAKREEICILCSSDSHYSMDKAGDIFSLDVCKVPVSEDTRELEEAQISKVIQAAQEAGKKHFIIVSNMMTTMFGSVDDVSLYVSAMEAAKCSYKLHVDGAYGGFYFPFVQDGEELTFRNPAISSFTLDAHKMAQAPYGTGLFLIRKGLMKYATTQEAKYVEGEDSTLIGSRSGANAIAVWMILMKNGPYGWREKIYILQKRTTWICEALDELGIEYYRNPHANIITVRSEHIPVAIAREYGLVPDDHHHPKWFKMVIMEHVTLEKVMRMVEALKLNLA